MPDLFAGLPRVTLGRYSPQERTESAIGRGERGAVIASLIEFSVLCRKGEAPPPGAITRDGLATKSGTKPTLLDRVVAMFD